MARYGLVWTAQQSAIPPVFVSSPSGPHIGIGRICTSGIQLPGKLSDELFRSSPRKFRFRLSRLDLWSFGFLGAPFQFFIVGLHR